MEEMDDSVLLDVINKALEKDFLCIPPYDISAFDVKKIYKEVVDGKEIKHHVTSRVLIIILEHIKWLAGTGCCQYLKIYGVLLM